MSAASLDAPVPDLTDSLTPLPPAPVAPDAPLAWSTATFDIDALDLQARGLSAIEGRPVYVQGALPGERVVARLTRRKADHDVARVNHWVRTSAQREHQPACPYFGICGGCAMQHLAVPAQVAAKQRVLEDALWHIGQVRPSCMLPPLHGPDWGYRRRARLSVRLVPKKGGVLVGFREKQGSYVADMRHCRVLPARVSDLLVPLRALVGGLSNPRSIPQIDVAMGDGPLLALILRHMQPLDDADQALLRQFAQAHDVRWWLQPKGPDTLHAMDDAAGPEDLYYDLPDYGLRMPFRPDDFTQVNADVNRAMIRRALQLLDVRPGHRVADLFCGLGNFSLPLARVAGAVTGVEGSPTLVQRARDAALRHGLSADFQVVDLFGVDTGWLRGLGRLDRLLVDPPRDGAEAVARGLAELPAEERPAKVVYVSCNPDTLARDAGLLDPAYRLAQAGVMNMFPHTGHVESIALFERRDAS